MLVLSILHDVGKPFGQAKHMHSEHIISDQIRIQIKIRIRAEGPVRIIEIPVCRQGQHAPVSQILHQRIRAFTAAHRGCHTRTAVRRTTLNFIFKHFPCFRKKDSLYSGRPAALHVTVPVISYVQNLPPGYFKIPHGRTKQSAGTLYLPVPGGKIQLLESFDAVFLQHLLHRLLLQIHIGY